ncbi:MAG: precorrin-6A synthase (deacetylating) [Pseudomonadota bacterium]
MTNAYEIWLVGIGTGSPHHLTLEGRSALRDAESILIPRKGDGKDDLAAIRMHLLEEIGATGRALPFDMPVRDEALPYQERVSRWHDDIAAVWQSTLHRSGVTGRVALMVWGDPGLFDSTLRIAYRLDPAPTLRVVPGITALQALTAAHAVPFNTVDGTVCVTTGRKLREGGVPANAETVFVMLDGACSFFDVDAADLWIWWGAFLGMREQILLSGPLQDIAQQIVEARAEARARHGWIMDTYMLRRFSDLEFRPMTSAN